MLLFLFVLVQENAYYYGVKTVLSICKYLFEKKHNYLHICIISPHFWDICFRFVGDKIVRGDQILQ